MLNETSQLIRGKFDPLKEQTSVSELGMEIRTYPFQSGNCHGVPEGNLLHGLRAGQYHCQEDELIAENGSFRYPVFCPEGGSPYNRAVILLHGLNERKWDKYFTWAATLVKQLNRPVILFPISFHLNRSPVEWIDPRMMAARAENRKSTLRDATDSTFINFALSERLSDHPERFYLSGLQTLDDLVLLLKQIREGNHPLFLAGTTADFFSYSIGGLLSQVLMIANPENLLDESRFFFFSSGATFCDMHGASKLIMDTPAHEKVQHYYRVELENSLSFKGKIADFFHGTNLGRAFRSMVAPDRYRDLRERTFSNFRNRINAVGISNDLVIPANKIEQTIDPEGRAGNTLILEPEYPYTHENPFPFKLSEYSQPIERMFNQIFHQAAVFLA